MHELRVDSALHVPQLPHVVLDAVDRAARPPEENISRGLDQPLTLDDPPTLVVVSATARVGRRCRRLRAGRTLMELRVRETLEPDMRIEDGSAPTHGAELWLTDPGARGMAGRAGSQIRQGVAALCDAAPARASASTRPR